MLTKKFLTAALACIAIASPAYAQQRARGVDVSKYQGHIDWNAVARSGLSFGIARVSDGLKSRDAYFPANWAGMKQAGLVRGVYQFFRPQQDAVAQADLLVSSVGFEAGDLPPILDVEVTDGAGSSRIAAGIAAWCHEITARTGLTPVIYTAPGFWNGLGISPPAGVELWVANWNVSAPRLARGWSAWTFWQFTDSYSVPGISPNGDGNYFNGSAADLRAWAASHGPGARSGATAPPPPPPVAQPTSGSQPTPILRQGSTGSAVVALQDDLRRKGFDPGPSDGVFGSRTRAVVIAFQKANGLVADGVVGPLTWSALTR